MEKPVDAPVDGYPGLKYCPKCKGITCFVLPDFDLDTGEIIGYSCPGCKTNNYKPKSVEEWIMKREKAE